MPEVMSKALGLDEEGTMTEAQQETLKKFRKRFPKNPEGLGQMLHGYLYFKYINLYVYYAKQRLNKLKYKDSPEKRDLPFPKGKYSNVLKDLISGAVEFMLPNTNSHETSQYHGKVLTYNDAQKMLSLKIDIDLPNLPKTIIPYDNARKLVIENPDHLTLIDCPCRAAQGPTGCYPRDVCMIIGEPWASFVLEHSADSNPRRITQEEGLQILKAEHERGHVHQVFFKDAAAGMVYSICNCCECCCTALAAHNYAHAPMVSTSGSICQIDYDKCQSCGTCVSTCPFHAVSIIDDKTVVEFEKCFGCGACESQCPHGAISLKLEPKKGEPLDMEAILEKYGNKESASNASN